MGYPEVLSKCFSLVIAAVCASSPSAVGATAGPPGDSGVRIPGSSPLKAKSADIVVIPLRGHFGFQPGADEWIDPDAFRQLVNQAKSLKPKFVVLDIESSGGLVVVMHSIAETIMKEFPEGAGCTPVAWPGTAGSAASFITLTCPKIVVKQGARVGAALTVNFTSKGVVAVDDLPEDKSGAAQKFKSFADALERSAMQFGGHPPEIRAAMSSQAASLYWSPSQRRFYSAPPDPKNRGDLQELDNPTSVLTMTAKEMTDFGLATSGDGEDGLRRALGLPPGATVIRLGDDLPRWFKAVSAAYGPSLADDKEKIQAFMTSFIDGLNEWLTLDQAVKINDAKRKASVTDKDRDRDAFEAAGRLLRSKREMAGRKAGSAATELKQIVERLDKSTRTLKALGSDPLVLPQSALLAPRIQASLMCHGKGDYRGALDILAAPSPPKK